METSAYQIARDDFCIAERANGIVSVTELYDYIIGTQSGAISGAMLALKDDNGYPMYNSTDVNEFYKTEGINLFIIEDVHSGPAFFIIMAFTILFTAMMYGIGVCLYNTKEMSKGTQYVV